MKKATAIRIAVLVLLLLALTPRLGAQGYVAFNNLAPNSGFVYLYDWIQGQVLLNEDINFELLGGPSPFSSLQPIAKWLLSDGSATGTNVAPGRFADPSHGVYAIPGVQPGDTAYLQLMGWRGNFDTFAAAVYAGSDTGVIAFNNPTGAADAAPGLTGLDSLIIGTVPEPSTIALAALGLAAWLVFRRCKPRPTARV